MDKIKKHHSLKLSFIIYISVCSFFCFAGAFGIGIGTNYLQDYYSSKYSYSNDESYRISGDEGILYYSFSSDNFVAEKYRIVYQIISDGQIVLIPLWVLLCVSMTGRIFYSCEMKKPIEILMNASKKISENQLDFKVECPKKNELGNLCTAFDNMREVLDKNNREMWHSLEERKRLNSAFSHDLRTPLTVLKGYTDYLIKYIPSGKIRSEKMTDVLKMMNSQIIRLEKYIQSMNSVQKLEDIKPDYSEIFCSELSKNFEESGKLICSDKQFEFSFSSQTENIFMDNGLLCRVYENLLSNAQRYAEEKVTADILISKTILRITVKDDGMGFSDEALKSASEPFFRENKHQNKEHFGLGLYICNVICEKCGGILTISNYKNGGMVMAEFLVKSNKNVV